MRRFTPRLLAKRELNRLRKKVWACEPDTLEALFSLLEVAELPGQDNFGENPDNESESSRSGLEVEDGVAYIAVNGLLMAEVPELFDMFGVDATSTYQIGDQIDEAVSREDVEQIVLQVNSPGGEVTGIPEVAGLIREAREVKPVRAEGNGLVASAAYWLASQAGEFTVTPSTEVGSIGTYTVLVDSSRAAEEAGYKVHLVRSGPLKGTGMDGVPISDAELAESQRLVDQITSQFVSDVSLGRLASIDDVKPLATGATWLAHEALELSLIDGVDKVSLSGLASTTSMTDMENANQANPVEDRIAALEARLSQVEAEKAKAEAIAEASKAALAEVESSAKAKVIDQGVAKGTVTPALRSKIEKLASTMTVDELSDFVAALPTQVRPEQDGAAPARPQAYTDKEAARFKRTFGMDPDDALKMFDIEGLSANGKLKLNDGTFVDPKEVL